MMTFRCDGCGKEMHKGDLRYTVKIEVRAAYDELEVSLMDLVRDHREEILELIERLQNKNTQEIEESVYKSFELDLCPSCQRIYIRNPLRFHPEQGVDPDQINIDGFLRSLGFSQPETPDETDLS